MKGFFQFTSKKAILAIVLAFFAVFIFAPILYKAPRCGAPGVFDGVEIPGSCTESIVPMSIGAFLGGGYSNIYGDSLLHWINWLLVVLWLLILIPVCYLVSCCFYGVSYRSKTKVMVKKVSSKNL